jgi:hypothetical protein
MDGNEINDFQEYGRLESGKNSGNLQAYKGYLEQIKAGNVVRKGDIRQKTEAERALLQTQINSIEVSNTQLQGQIDIIQHRTVPTQGQIPENEKEIKKIQDEIYEIKQGSTVYQTFSWFNCIFLFVIWSALSLYLFSFYIAISYSAFYGLDPNSLLQGKSLSIPILPHFDEVMKAASTNYFLLLVPFIFFAAGAALDYLLKKTSNLKYLPMFLLLLMVLLGDGFIAYKIHQQAMIALEYVVDENQVNDFMAAVWYEDVNFYIVLILGFVAFLIWSIIYHAFQAELDKRKTIQTRLQRITDLENLNKELRQKIGALQAEINTNLRRINNLREEMEKESVSVQSLEKNVNDFTVGWTTIISGLFPNEKDVRIAEIQQECNNFLNSIKSISISKIHD